MKKPYTPIPYIMQAAEPAEEPITLTEVKGFLRIDHTDEDGAITALITAARKQVERFIRRSLITQSWTLSFDDSAPTKTLLLRGPVQSVTSVKMIARDGTETTLANTAYYLNAGKEILVFDTVPISHMVEIEYVAGYGNASAVPNDIKQGLLTYVAALYAARPGEVSMPIAAQQLLMPYRIVLA